ncbi:MAG: hypothetical protein ACREXU_21230 [Gammaproteobacteria bacterium]
MTPTAILNHARAAGVTLWVEGDELRYRGPRGALAKFLRDLKAHKPAIPGGARGAGCAQPVGRAPRLRGPPEPRGPGRHRGRRHPAGDCPAFEQAAIARGAEDLKEFSRREAPSPGA